MSEDEVKPQAGEPTTEAAKKEEIKEGKNEENGDKVEDKEEAEEEDVKQEEEEEKEEEEEDKEEEAEEDKDEAEEEEEEDEDKDEEEMEVDEKEEKEEKKTVKPRKKNVAAAPETPEAPETPDKNVVPLYDQPLTMSGKRDRKKVERFIQEEKKERALEIDGRGTALGDIPFINYMLSMTLTDELRPLHRVALNRRGKGSEIKKNLRQFNGFSYTKDDKKYEAKMETTQKLRLADIKKMLLVLGLERGGFKGELVTRLMEFLENPQDHGKKPPKEVKKGSGKRGRPKQGQGKSKNSSAEAVSDADSDEKSEKSDADSDADSSRSEDEEGEEEEEKKKPKKTPAKKTPAKKTPAKKTPQAKKAPVKRPASSKKSAKVSKTVSSSSDDSSDDEPLAKKTKQPPTDGEIKAMVKKILDGANLEEVTMKSVCRQVYDSYPDFDLSHKKDFIKETVKAIIS